MEAEKPADNEAEMNALLEALGGEGADAMIAELLKGESPPEDGVATKPREIRSRVRDLASKHPELIIKIINHWITEDRRRK